MAHITRCTNCCKKQPTVQSDLGLICCTVCGKVVDQDIYSSEPTFVKNAAGQSQMSGNYVKTVQSDYSASRERTLNNAYDFITHIADNMGIGGGDQIAKPAVAFYTIALERNFTRGRRADQVAAACLYIACRENKRPFLLIEFAEFLGVNVYVLGAVFLQLCKLLSLEEHPIVQKPVDPSLFIHRFSNVLLGQMNHEVEKTALHIMASMKRDWMQTGRKPSGLCGAALYISALSHGHKLSKNDITRVVHICEATLTKRLIEFEDTASGSLTIEELNQNAEELDRNLRTIKDTGSGHESEKRELVCEHKGSGRPHFAHGLCESCHEELINITGGFEGGAEPPAFQRAERERMAKVVAAKGATDTCGAPEQLQSSTTANLDNGRGSLKADKFEGLGNVDSGGNSTKGGDTEFIEDADESGNFSDIDDAEMESYLHNEDEKKFKKAIWEEMNREYLEEQAAKEAAAAAVREAELASLRNCTPEELASRELAAAVAAELAKAKKEQRRKRAAESKTHQSAAEATHKTLTRMRLSSKVNLDVLKEIFDEPVDSNSSKKQKTQQGKDIDENDDDWGPIGNEEDYNQSNAQEEYDYFNDESVFNEDTDFF